jgi:hypothetical protein
MGPVNLRDVIFQAINRSPYNKNDTNVTPGTWACWINEPGVYGEQMQTSFCLKCGEYEWLNYKECPEYYRYTPSPSEPSVCRCIITLNTSEGHRTV